MMPVFPIRLLLVFLPVAIAAGVLGLAASKGGGFLKNQGVAWFLTALMVVAAVFIGIGKSPLNNPKPEAAPAPNAAPPTALPEPGYSAAPVPGSSESFVWDNARVLSSDTVGQLDQRNERLWNNCSVSIGVVTCNYGGDDLYGYAMQCAEDMGLGGYDMIVVLDIQGDNYWLLQGDDIRGAFTDNDSSNYAYDYMEQDFARGNYDAALLSLTKALEEWYESHF